VRQIKPAQLTFGRTLIYSLLAYLLTICAWRSLSQRWLYNYVFIFIHQWITKCNKRRREVADRCHVSIFTYWSFPYAYNTHFIFERTCAWMVKSSNHGWIVCINIVRKRPPSTQCIILYRPVAKSPARAGVHNEITTTGVQTASHKSYPRPHAVIPSSTLPSLPHPRSLLIPSGGGRHGRMRNIATKSRASDQSLVMSTRTVPPAPVRTDMYV